MPGTEAKFSGRREEGLGLGETRLGGVEVGEAISSALGVDAAAAPFHVEITVRVIEIEPPDDSAEAA